VVVTWNSRTQRYEDRRDRLSDAEYARLTPDSKIVYAREQTALRQAAERTRPTRQEQREPELTDEQYGRLSTAEKIAYAREETAKGPRPPQPDWQRYWATRFG
jgi:hypothetical protein